MYDMYLFYPHYLRNVGRRVKGPGRCQVGQQCFTNGQGRVRQDAFVEADVDVERVQMMPKSRDLAMISGETW